MSDVIPFLPKANVDAAENIAQFVLQAKSHAVSLGISDFNSDAWDVTDLVSWKARGKKRTRVTFLSQGKRKGKSSEPMQSPFREFAKSCIVNFHMYRPTKSIHFRMGALRALERALFEVCGKPNAEMVSPHVLNRAQALIVAAYGHAAAYRVCGQLELVADYISRNHMVVSKFSWAASVGRPSDADRVGQEFDARRKQKLPSQSALDALPIIFRRAKDAVDVIATSAAAILVSSPDRIGELLLLREDCEVWQTVNGRSVYGLRWWPEKGAAPMIKWIVPSMREVVIEALQKIREVTEPARTVARWYEENPGSIYLSKGAEHLREREWLNVDEIALSLGITRSGAATWVRRYKLSSFRGSDGCNLYRMKDVERAIVSDLPAGFPILDRDTGLRFSEALFVVRSNELHQGRSVVDGTLRALDTNFFNTAFGRREKFGFTSVFSRFGLSEPDGSPITLTTHQFRHYLNTLAQAGGLSQLDIAKWSGRKDVRQNAVYDHMTSDEILALVRESIGDEARFYGPLAQLPPRLPISRDEFASLVAPTAHVTSIGYCLHDYSMSPCEISRDCINCRELVCVKGDVGKREAVSRQLNDLRRLLEKAEEACASGQFGADRWRDHHVASLQRLEQLYSLLTDPNVPDGTVIQLGSPSGDRALDSMAEFHRLPRS